jgi:hypothetical protein
MFFRSSIDIGCITYIKFLIFPAPKHISVIHRIYVSLP